MLTVIPLQIAVIVLKLKNRQDIKREKRVVVFIIALLVVGASCAISTRRVSGYELPGLVGFMLLTLLALLTLAVSWMRFRGRSR